MKTTLLKFTALLIILAGVFASCKPDDEPNVNVVMQRFKPIDIPFKEYSLEGTSCQWTNLPYDEKVIIINSMEELENYLTCTGGNFPEIDFSKNTLLLVSGEKHVGISMNTLKRIEQIKINGYKLYVEVSLDDKKPNQKWSNALLIKRINSDSKVELNLTTVAYNLGWLILQPFDIIQATILGKWRVKYYTNNGHVGFHSFENSFVEITKDSVVCSGDFLMFLDEPSDMIYPFSYRWERKEVITNSKPFITYVMQNDDKIINGWYFLTIRNDELSVGLFPSYYDYEYFVFVRI